MPDGMFPQYGGFSLQLATNVGSRNTFSSCLGMVHSANHMLHPLFSIYHCIRQYFIWPILSEAPHACWTLCAGHPALFSLPRWAPAITRRKVWVTDTVCRAPRCTTVVMSGTFRISLVKWTTPRKTARLHVLHILFPLRHPCWTMISN